MDRSPFFLSSELTEILLIFFKLLLQFTENLAGILGKLRR